jgi:hypothetical protein
LLLLVLVLLLLVLPLVDLEGAVVADAADTEESRFGEY